MFDWPSSRAKTITSQFNLEEIRVLLIEDDPTDAKRVQRLLKKAKIGHYSVDWCQVPDEALTTLAKGQHEVCLLDYRLSGISGLEILSEVVSRKIETPIIMLTGMAGDDVDLSAMQYGACDFLVKDEVDAVQLTRSIRYAVKQGRLLKELRDLATRDTATGLLNHRHFKTSLGDAVARTRRHGKQMALLFLDLDGFKQINDTHGHSAGDLVIETVAHRLQNLLRETDTIGRIGGDEFAIILEHINDTSGIEGVAHKLINVISAPITWENEHVNVGVSVGITICPDDSDDPERLLKTADTAMYQAKKMRQANGSYEFYDFEMETQVGTWPNEEYGG